MASNNGERRKNKDSVCTDALRKSKVGWWLVSLDETDLAKTVHF